MELIFDTRLGQLSLPTSWRPGWGDFSFSNAASRRGSAPSLIMPTRRTKTWKATTVKITTMSLICAHASRYQLSTANVRSLNN